MSETCSLRSQVSTEANDEAEGGEVGSRVIDAVYEEYSNDRQRKYLVHGIIWKLVNAKTLVR